MAKSNDIKITVIKKIDAHQIFGDKVPSIEGFASTCPRVQEGQQFVIKPGGNMPEGFCTWAWADIHRDIIHLMFGGDFPHVKEKGAMYSCCTDGFRPVIFKLEKV